MDQELQAALQRLAGSRKQPPTEVLEEICTLFVQLMQENAQELHDVNSVRSVHRIAMAVLFQIPQAFSLRVARPLPLQVLHFFLPLLQDASDESYRELCALCTLMVVCALKDMAEAHTPTGSCASAFVGEAFALVKRCRDLLEDGVQPDAAPLDLFRNSMSAFLECTGQDWDGGEPVLCVLRQSTAGLDALLGWLAQVLYACQRTCAQAYLSHVSSASCLGCLVDALLLCPETTLPFLLKQIASLAASDSLPHALWTHERLDTVILACSTVLTSSSPEANASPGSDGTGTAVAPSLVEAAASCLTAIVPIAAAATTAPLRTISRQLLQASICALEGLTPPEAPAAATPGRAAPDAASESAREAVLLLARSLWRGASLAAADAAASLWGLPPHVARALLLPGEGGVVQGADGRLGGDDGSAQDSARSKLTRRAQHGTSPPPAKRQRTAAPGADFASGHSPLRSDLRLERAADVHDASVAAAVELLESAVGEGRARLLVEVEADATEHPGGGERNDRDQELAHAMHLVDLMLEAEQSDAQRAALLLPASALLASAVSRLNDVYTPTQRRAGGGSAVPLARSNPLLDATLSLALSCAADALGGAHAPALAPALIARVVRHGREVLGFVQPLLSGDRSALAHDAQAGASGAADGGRHAADAWMRRAVCAIALTAAVALAGAAGVGVDGTAGGASRAAAARGGHLAWLTGVQAMLQQVPATARGRAIAASAAEFACHVLAVVERQTLVVGGVSFGPSVWSPAALTQALGDASRDANALALSAFAVSLLRGASGVTGAPLLASSIAPVITALRTLQRQSAAAEPAHAVDILRLGCACVCAVRQRAPVGRTPPATAAGAPAGAGSAGTFETPRGEGCPLAPGLAEGLVAARAGQRAPGLSEDGRVLLLLALDRAMAASWPGAAPAGGGGGGVVAAYAELLLDAIVDGGPAVSDVAAECWARAAPRFAQIGAQLSLEGHGPVQSPHAMLAQRLRQSTTAPPANGGKHAAFQRLATPLLDSWPVMAAADQDELTWTLVKTLTRPDAAVAATAADLIISIAHMKRLQPADLVLGSRFLLRQLGCHAAAIPSAIKELLVVMPHLSATHIAWPVALEALPELCVRRDRAAIDRLAEYLPRQERGAGGGARLARRRERERDRDGDAGRSGEVDCMDAADLVDYRLPQVVSHVLWLAGGGALKLDDPVLNETLLFLEQLMQPKLSFDKQLTAEMQTTKLELVYEAGGASRWDDCGFVNPQVVEVARHFLGVLTRMDASGRAAAAGASGSVRRLLSVEEVEWLVQSFGQALSPAAAGPTSLRNAEWGIGGAGSGTKGREGADGDLSTGGLLTRRDGLQALRSIVVLIVLMGDEVTPHTFKFMAAISPGLGLHGAVQLQAIRGWHQLVKTLAQHAPDMLRQIAAQLMGRLLPILNAKTSGDGAATPSAANRSPPEQAAAIELLQELIVQHRKVLGKDVLKRLPPLPEDIDLPDLAPVRDVLHRAKGKLCFKDDLEILVGNLDNQAQSVRHAALGNLRRFLTAHRQAVIDLAAAQKAEIPVCRLDNAGEMTLPARLMRALLRCCDPARTADIIQDMYLRCGDCLGLLGALDPSLISLKLPPPAPVLESPQELKTEIFRHILRILRTAPSLAVVDMCTYSLHGLRVHTFEGDDDEASALEAWNELLESLDDADRSLAKQYDHPASIKLRQVTPSTASGGVLMAPGREHLSFRRWLDQWLRQLMQRCPPGDVRRLLELTDVAQRFDVSLMLFILPHSLLFAMTAPDAARGPASGRPGLEVTAPDGAAARKAVLAEMGAVLQACRPSQDGVGAGVRRMPRAAMHLQAVVSALDSLHRWQEASARELRRLATERSRSSRGAKTSFDEGEARPEEVELQRRLSAFLQFQASLTQGRADGVTLQDLAHASHWCGADARALRYYETWLRANARGVSNPPRAEKAALDDEEVTTLMNVYRGLQDPDAVLGLVTLRAGGPTNADWISAAEKAGRWDEVAALYEVEQGQTCSSDDVPTIGRSAPLPRALYTGEHGEGYLHSMLAAGKPQLLLSVAEGWLQRAGGGHALRARASAAGIAAAWRVGDWGSLQRFLQVIDTHRLHLHLSGDEWWETSLGHVLLHCRTGRLEAARALADSVKVALADQMAPAGMESYERALPLVAKLHMLQDVKQIALQVSKPPLGSVASDVREQLLAAMARVDTTAADVASRTSMLALLRALAALRGFPEAAAATWMPQVRVCRAMSQLDAAGTAVLEAEKAGVPGAFIARAELLWEKGDHTRAIDALRFGLAHVESLAQGDEQREALLHRGRLRELAWTAEQGHGAPSKLSEQFGALVNSGGDDESHLQYASYLDKLYVDARNRQRQLAGLSDEAPAPGIIVSQEEACYLDYLPLLLKHYGLAATQGTRHVHHALPRLLTIYCEFGSDSHQVAALSGAGAGSGTARARTLKSLNDRLTDEAQSAALHAQFDTLRKSMVGSGKLLTVITQAISRITHEDGATSIKMQRLVAQETTAFPHHCLWMLAALRTSPPAEARRKASNTVHTHVRRSNETLKALVASYEALCAQLQELAARATHKASVLDLATEAPGLMRLLPSPVMIPTLSAFEHASALHLREGELDAYVTISGMKNRVAVMASITFPKQIHFVGSDGHTYRFLLKPKDDLRGDMRVMEYGCLLNRLLNHDAEATRRQLKAKTFMCIPLSKDAGLVEWVMNTVALRAVLKEAYEARGIPFPYQNLPGVKVRHEGAKKAYDKTRDPAALRRWLMDAYQTNPPLMHTWFLAKFSEPANWLQARLNFTASTATWCVAGHMIGLGDRHCDNVVVDEVSGGAVHIDFGIIFDRGMALAVPEVVPFRLTQNVVDGLGVAGVEGGFRHSCHAVLKVLRANRQVLMSVLQAIVHDPFINWQNARAPQQTARPGAKGGRSAAAAPSSEEWAGMKALATIDGRLQGVLAGVYNHRTVQMTVQGHVDYLLREATDPSQLCKMYIGWMAMY